MRALLASPLGFLVGLSLGALGGGGSILAVPALVYVAGQEAQAATTTSLVVVGLVALLGVGPHWHGGRVRVRAGVLFGLAGVVGSIAGSRANAEVDPDLLLTAFAAVMLVAAAAMWRRARPHTVEPSGATVATRVRTDAATVARVVAGGTVVGLLTGFFGVGGGFVIVPALVLALRFSMPEAVGTSLLVIAINATVALAARVGAGSFEWEVIVPFTIAGMFGVLTGNRVANRVAAERLVRWFALLLVAVACYTAIQSLTAL